MYGKIFEDIFCSTLMDFGGDTAYVFIAMIVLSDENGVIKHTAESLARMICKDASSVKQAIGHLEAQDLESNLKGHEGRRIVPLYELSDDETRGWLVVNKDHYRDKKDLGEVRQQNRVRAQRFRDKHNAASRDVTLHNAESRHTDTDTDTDTTSRANARANGARHAKPDISPIVITLPLREGGDFEVRQSLVAELEPLYPAVDLQATLREMRAWLLMNAERRKTKRGVRRFIGSWLQGEQEKHGG